MRRRKKSHTDKIALIALVALIGIVILNFLPETKEDIAGQAIGTNTCTSGHYFLSDCDSGVDGCNVVEKCVNGEIHQCTNTQCQGISIEEFENKRLNTGHQLERVVNAKDDAWFVNLKIDAIVDLEPEQLEIQKLDSTNPSDVETFDRCRRVGNFVFCDYTFDFRENGPEQNKNLILSPGVRQKKASIKSKSGGLLDEIDLTVTVEDPDGLYVGADVRWVGASTGNQQCLAAGFSLCTEAFDAQGNQIPSCNDMVSNGFAKCQPSSIQRVTWSAPTSGNQRCLSNGLPGCIQAFIKTGALYTPISCQQLINTGQVGSAVCSDNQDASVSVGSGTTTGVSICDDDVLQSKICFSAFNEDGVEMSCRDLGAHWAVCSENFVATLGEDIIRWNTAGASSFQGFNFVHGKLACAFNGRECRTAISGTTVVGCESIQIEASAICRATSDIYETFIVDPTTIGIGGSVEPIDTCDTFGSHTCEIVYQSGTPANLNCGSPILSTTSELHMVLCRKQ